MRLGEDFEQTLRVHWILRRLLQLMMVYIDIDCSERTAVDRQTDKQTDKQTDRDN